MQNINYVLENSVAYVTLNRPSAMNALNFQLLCELEQVLEDIRIDSSIRAVVFRGNGEKAFSAGADLKERKTLTEAQVRRNVNKIGEVFILIDHLPQPTIAAINGIALGGGMELALACDFRVASESAILGLTETGLGIIPGAGGTQRLPRLIGESKALELILTAKRMTAQEALDYGVVTQITSADQLDNKVDTLLQSLLANAPIAIQQAKFSIKQGMNTDLHTGLAIERKAYEITLPTEDRIEALKAFAEKRKPIFKGK
ncbi:enoyl-CoA hydratase [Sporosarcina sp. PTS2304]|uniref:enoyl-CoA hydratase-related protein n=1 Tax=Sporosarcina sp. PTS2304 TaxID=2283194 RepID=UPI000E0D5DD2|nr:enoyl-CoA hydratase-related protein [Sporosarcina sp. PTS2304]AXH99552.1 enoyl-CoA hydratase [Sporosarcina sp. PTS2304]